MTALWVDTDFGFDDLWAILLLRHHGIKIAGASLSFGCGTLNDAIAHALGARAAFGLDMQLYRGADRPLVRPLETAERVLGASGMRSRGKHLPRPTSVPELPIATAGMRAWIDATKTPTLLAIGPLTNIASLLQSHPDAAQKIARIVWMGGSNGPGNHSPSAEFNALADPEAADIVAQSGIPLDVIDLEICRKVTFGTEDMPEMSQPTADLLGGYLDIALTRGRDRMSIYDPVAACAVIAPQHMDFTPVSLDVCTTPGANYGATRFSSAPGSSTRLATAGPPHTMATCLAALATREPC